MREVNTYYFSLSGASIMATPVRATSIDSLLIWNPEAGRYNPAPEVKTYITTHWIIDSLSFNNFSQSRLYDEL